MHVVRGAEVWGEGCEDAGTDVDWVSALSGSLAYPEVSGLHVNRHDFTQVRMARKEPCICLPLDWKAEWNPACACRFLHRPLIHTFIPSLFIECPV